MSALLEDPRNTIDFDAALDREIRQRAAAMGADGKALPGVDGTPYRVNLAEKLLVLALARLFNYIPEAGLWMNTQRPEWNDANNALVGYGVSMVTLCYLRRFLSLSPWPLRRPPGRPRSRSLRRSPTLFTGWRRRWSNTRVCSTARSRTATARPSSIPWEPPAATTGPGSTPRVLGDRTPLTVAELGAFCDVALRHIDHSIRANRRSDGLYHAYNLMKLAGDGIGVRHLYEMLEGQVAVLSSGALSVRESAALLDALREQQPLPRRPEQLPAVPRPKAARLPREEQHPHRRRGKVEDADRDDRAPATGG